MPKSRLSRYGTQLCKLIESENSRFPVFINVCPKQPTTGDNKAMGVVSTTSLPERVTVTPGVRSGQPIIRGTRTTVADILEWLASGASEKEILGDFPWLGPMISGLRWRTRPSNFANGRVEAFTRFQSFSEAGPFACRSVSQSFARSQRGNRGECA